MTEKNGMDMAREMALFRFSMIAPVIQNTYSDSSASAYFKRVTENPLMRPDGTAFQYCYKTLERWTSNYHKFGLDGLTPKKRNDVGTTRTLTNECMSEIYQIKEKFPKLNASQIHTRLLQLGLISSSVSVRTIQRFVKNHDLKNGITPTSGKDRKAFEEEFFGDMWMADTCFLPYIREDGINRRTYLIAIIDDHSRLIVGSQIFYEDNAYNFQKVLKDAVATYGIPKKLYVDSGSPYRNSQLPFICAEIGTVLIHAPVRDGASKAKIERFFGVLKSRWLHGFDVTTISSLSDFNQKLNTYIREHNTMINSSIKCAPMDRFLASRNHISVPKSSEWLDLCFMNRQSRKVRLDSTITLLNTLFDAPIPFIGQSVEVRFLPDRLDDAYIYEAGTKYPLKLTDKIANSKAKRNNLPTIDYSMEVHSNV
jgi:transposase InsO family protein